MILVISNKSDIHCNPIIEKLKKKGEEFFRLNTEDLFTHYRFEYNFIDPNKKPYLSIFSLDTQKTLNSHELKSVWERRPLTQVYEFQNDKYATAINEEYDELTKWIRGLCFEGRYLGHHYLDRVFENKLKQISLAYNISRSLPFKNLIKIPETIVTNDFDKLKSFVNSSKAEHFAIKPISADSIQLDELSEMPFMSSKVDRDVILGFTQAHLDTAPSFTQAYIEKDYELRVTVIGSKALTCKIDSQKLKVGCGREDWRQGYDHNLGYQWIDTPVVIQEFCFEYLRKTGLNFGCFDFIMNLEGCYYFLECNPNGQWMWLENETQIPISDAIANYLSAS